MTERESEWIVRIQQGDASAFAQLFYSYYPRLCEFVRISVQSDEDAEEAASDVLFALWDRRADNVPLDNFAPYLFAAVKNRAYMAIRSRERRWRREEEYVREHSSDDPADLSLSMTALSRDEMEQIIAIREIVETLPARCRKIFVLRWTSHLPYAEIARIMDVSVKTVENQLAIAMKRLREHLK